MVRSEEKSLLQLLKNGDKKSFEFTFRYYYEPLLGYALSILKVEAEAEEVVQELFLKIWRDRKKIIIKHSLAAYLYKSVYNQCLNRLQKEKLLQEYQKFALEQPATEVNADEMLKYEELNRKFFELMDALPERRQLIFKLNRFQGLKYREIADRLSISIKTVEANMSKALQYFRRNLQDYRL